MGNRLSHASRDIRYLEEMSLQGTQDRLVPLCSGVGLPIQHHHNYVNTFMYPNVDNPNIPHPKNPFTKDFSLYNVAEKGTDEEYSSIATDIGAYPKAPEP